MNLSTVKQEPTARDRMKLYFEQVIFGLIRNPEKYRWRTVQAVPDGAEDFIDGDLLTAWKYVSQDAKTYGQVEKSRVISAANGDGEHLTELFDDLMEQDLGEDPGKPIKGMESVLQEEIEADADEYEERMAIIEADQLEIPVEKPPPNRDRLVSAQANAILTAGTLAPMGVKPDPEEKTPPVSSRNPFPAPPGKDAFYGLAGEFVRLIEPHTEGDPTAVLAQFLTMFGNMIGRGPYAPIGAGRHYTNLFTVIVGATGKGRKGVSEGEARRPLALVDEVWAQDRNKGGLSSGEGLIMQVRDPIEKQEPIKTKGKIDGYQTVVEDPGESDKRLMVVETELASAIRALGRDGNILSAVIRQAWDHGNLAVMTRKSPLKATDAHISIIGHITPQELRRYLDATEKANGFANRFLWVCVKRSKFLSRGGNLNLADLAPFLRRLSAAVSFARKTGVAPVTWDEKGGLYWDMIYPRLTSGGVGLAGEVVSRAEPQVLRLSLIYALLDESSEIQFAHVRAAEALWNYCEESVRHVFGCNLGDPVADKILKALQAKPKGMTRSEIRDYLGRNSRSEDIGRALDVIHEQGAAYSRTDDQTGGRPAERWFSMTGEQPADDNGEEEDRG